MFYQSINPIAWVHIDLIYSFRFICQEFSWQYFKTALPNELESLFLKPKDHMWRNGLAPIDKVIQKNIEKLDETLSEVEKEFDVK